MDSRQILEEYVDACELIKETEEDIKRLKKKRKTIEQDSVRGSNPEYPYNEQHFKVEGTAFTYEDDTRIRREEEILEERKQHAEQIRQQAQGIINQAPVRIQRIIRFRYMQKLPWDQVASRMHGGATVESVRKELKRFFEKN